MWVVWNFHSCGTNDCPRWNIDVRRCGKGQFVCFVTFGGVSKAKGRAVTHRSSLRHGSCRTTSHPVSNCHLVHNHCILIGIRRMIWFMSDLWPISKESTLYNRAQLLSANSPSLKYISTEVKFFSGNCAILKGPCTVFQPNVLGKYCPDWVQKE